MFTTHDSYRVLSADEESEDGMCEWRAFNLEGSSSCYVAYLRYVGCSAPIDFAYKLTFFAALSDLLQISLSEDWEVAVAQLISTSREGPLVTQVQDIQRVLACTEPGTKGVTHLLEFSDGTYLAVPYGVSTITKNQVTSTLVDLRKAPCEGRS